MTEAKAAVRHVRISPRKARLIIDIVRGKNTKEALTILYNSPKKAAGIISKLIKSVEANAEHNYDMDQNNLYIKEAYVNEGPTMKRMKPRAMGRADIINKRTSHITVVVCENENNKEG